MTKHVEETPLVAAAKGAGLRLPPPEKPAEPVEEPAQRRPRDTCVSDHAFRHHDAIEEARGRWRWD